MTPKYDKFFVCFQRFHIYLHHGHNFHSLGLQNCQNQHNSRESTEPCTNHVDNEGGRGVAEMTIQLSTRGRGCQGFVYLDKKLLNFTNICSIVNGTKMSILLGLYAF